MKKSIKIKIWAFFMRIGSRCGCHQMESRSFEIKGWQFPVCSRCTGVLLGQIIGVVIYISGLRIPIYLDCIFLFLMFMDWFLQYRKIRESTNLRRLITGTLAGIAQVCIVIDLMLYIINLMQAV